jgi:transcriptional regulator with XRE-family HTH domain
MIKNDKQLAITKNNRVEFIKSLDELKIQMEEGDLFKELMINSITSQIESFDREISEYECLKNGKPLIIDSTIETLPEALIKVRISKGMTQKDLADKIGLKEQQIQRYESNNYESANFGRILNVAASLDISFEGTRLYINDVQLEVEGYDPNFIREATQQLQSKKYLLAV